MSAKYIYLYWIYSANNWDDLEKLGIEQSHAINQGFFDLVGEMQMIKNTLVEA